jgi:hypothetical protein
VDALLHAKKRYWAEINGGLAGAPPLPDPDMYIDVVVDDDGSAEVDAEVEAEYVAAVRDMERTRTRCGTTTCRCPPAGTRDDVAACMAFTARGSSVASFTLVEVAAQKQ